MGTIAKAVAAAVIMGALGGCKSCPEGGAQADGNGEPPAYECAAIEMKAQHALTIRLRTGMNDLSRAIGESFGAIARHLAARKEMPAGPPFAAYYSKDGEDMDVEFGFPVSRKLPGSGNVKPGQCPAGKGISCVHTGPYEGIPAAYEALAGWAAKNGFKTGGVTYEIYLNDPSKTAPEDLKTRIFIPVE